jgi:periplasmic copper chaperone A
MEGYIVKLFSIAFAALCMASGLASGHNYRLDGLTIDHPFARATPPGAKSGGAFLVVDNGGSAPDRLLRATSPAAGAVELHQMAMDNGIMKMRALAAMDVPSGGRLELKPGGFHLMMVDIKQPLKAGDQVPLTLIFEKAGSIDVVLEVESMGAAGGHKQ